MYVGFWLPHAIIAVEHPGDPDMTIIEYRYQRTFRLCMENGGDSRAPGGAVTVGLCGSWDHSGPCRWPHYSSVKRMKNDRLKLTVEFNCSDEDYGEVISRIDAALASGELVGPDGVLSRWTATLID